MSRTVVLVLLVAAITGCGRIHFAPVGDRDASGSDGVAGDGPGSGGFSAPVHMTELSTAGRDDEPSLTDDMLDIYFVSDRPPSMQLDIWWATRASTADPFGAPVQVAGVDTAGNELTPRISGDGLTLVFSSDRAPSVSIDLWITTRPTRADAWGAAVRIAELSSMFQDSAGSLSPSGLEIIYSAQVVGLGDDFFESSRASLGAMWAPPVAVDSINTPAEEFGAVLVDQGREIYFASDRDGDPNLYVARRPARGTPFSTPVELVELSTPTSNDNYPWVSPDRRTIYFSRDGEIYFATR